MSRFYSRELSPLYIGMAAAAVSGILLGNVLRIHPYTFYENDGGPQQVYSKARDYVSNDAEGQILYRPGSVPGYVVGTDWLPGGRHNRPVEIEVAAIEPAPQADVPPQFIQASTAEPAPDRAGELPKISLADHQGGGQIDYLAHRADEDAVLGEPTV